jgi:hypothetical protein
MKTYAATLPILFAALLHRVAAQNGTFNIFKLDGLFHACPNAFTDNCKCLAANNDGATIDPTDSDIQQIGAVWTINGLCGQPALDAYTVEVNSASELAVGANIYVHDANPVNQVGVCTTVDSPTAPRDLDCSQGTFTPIYTCQGVC